MALPRVELTLAGSHTFGVYNLYMTYHHGGCPFHFMISLRTFAFVFTFVSLTCCVGACVLQQVIRYEAPTLLFFAIRSPRALNSERPVFHLCSCRLLTGLQLSLGDARISRRALSTPSVLPGVWEYQGCYV